MPRMVLHYCNVPIENCLCLLDDTSCVVVGVPWVPRTAPRVRHGPCHGCAMVRATGVPRVCHGLFHRLPRRAMDCCNIIVTFLLRAFFASLCSSCPLDNYCTMPQPWCNIIATFLLRIVYACLVTFHRVSEGKVKGVVGKCLGVATWRSNIVWAYITITSPVLPSHSPCPA